MGLEPERSVRVLVVEDDPKIAAMLTKGLRARAFDVESVATGREAVARVERGDIDVQLLDLGLPDIDGLDVLRELRSRQSKIPVIVITARSDPTDRETALSLGVVEYLTKPFSWAQLWAAIEACVPNGAE